MLKLTKYLTTGCVLLGFSLAVSANPLLEADPEWVKLKQERDAQKTYISTQAAVAPAPPGEVGGDWAFVAPAPDSFPGQIQCNAAIAGVGTAYAYAMVNTSGAYKGKVALRIKIGSVDTGWVQGDRLVRTLSVSGVSVASTLETDIYGLSATMGGKTCVSRWILKQ